MARLQVVLRVFFAALAVLLPLTLVLDKCGAEEPLVIRAQTGSVKGRAIEAINAGDYSAAINILEKSPSPDPLMKITRPCWPRHTANGDGRSRAREIFPAL